MRASNHPFSHRRDESAVACPDILAPDIMVVDDHPLYREALAAIVRQVAGSMQKVIGVGSAEECLRIARNHPRIKLVFLDLRMPRVYGNDALASLRRALPDAAIVVVSATVERREIDAALRAGARAFVSKSVSATTLEDVIQRALKARLNGSEIIAPQADAAAPQAELSARQRQVLLLLSEGHPNKEIGLRLGIEEITVKQHVTKIFKALGVSNRTQAVLASRNAGLDA